MKKQMAWGVLLSLVVSILVFVVGTFLIGGFGDRKSASVDISDEYSIIAGVIRNVGDGWTLIQDPTHETIGIHSVEEDDEKIIIKYDEYQKVNSLNVSVDETMAQEGYTVGASVGPGQSFIFIYDREGNLVAPEKYMNDKGNIWVNGIFKK